MKKDITILLISIALIAVISGCSKGQLPQPKKPQAVIVSERYTNPPSINPNGTWKYYKIVRDTLHPDIDYRSYEDVKPDTIRSTCSIDKRDSAFKIEIRKYTIINKQ